MSNSAGGIVGFGVYKLEDCYNEGKIQALGTERTNGQNTVGCAGGIVGSGATMIYNCINNGEVISNISAGGIIGYKYAQTLEIVNNYNKSTVNGKSYSGGIIGETMAGNVKIYNSYNQGKVSGTNILGGIAGYKYWTTIMSIYNCYNTGNIEGTNKTKIGEIVGVCDGGEGAYENKILELKKCYYCHNDKNPIGNKTLEGAIFKEENQIKKIDFKDELNSNKEELKQDGVDITYWKDWIQEQNSYPTL